MRLPRLNRKLVLETPEQVPDGAGGFTDSWVEQGTLWAQITPRTGAEATGEDTAMSRSRLKIIVRAAGQDAPSRPRPEQRFREGIRVFHILSVTESDADAHYLVCHAQEEMAT